MSERVELELLRRLEAMTVERDKERERRETSVKTEIQNLIERAEEYYEATFKLNDAERVMRATDSAKDATPHELVDAQVSLFGCKTEALRAAGALLRAVEAYREANK